MSKFVIATMVALFACVSISANAAEEVNYYKSKRTDVVIDDDLGLVCVRLFIQSTSSTTVSNCWTYSQTLKDSKLNAILTKAKKELNKGEH